MLDDAKIQNSDGEVVFDCAARGLVAIMVTVDVGDKHVQIIQPVPEKAVDWMGPMLASTAQQTADQLA